MIVRNVLIVYLGILLAVMIWIQPVMGILAFGTAVLVFLYYHYKAMKYFGGITGDLAGYFLCLCEVGIKSPQKSSYHTSLSVSHFFKSLL